MDILMKGQLICIHLYPPSKLVSQLSNAIIKVYKFENYEEIILNRPNERIVPFFQQMLA